MVKRSNTTLSRPTYQRTQSPSPDFKPLSQRNLRFFGDTDLESMSKSSTANRKRTPLNPNSSQSLQNLRTHRNVTRADSDQSQKIRSATSMQNLNRVNRFDLNELNLKLYRLLMSSIFFPSQDFRSKYLLDLSESTSENENMNGDRKPHNAVKIHHSTPNSKHKTRRQYSSTEYLSQKKSHEPVRSEKNPIQRQSRSRDRDLYEEHSLYNEKTAEELHRSALRERNGRSTSETRHLPPKGPTKPAREAERRRALSKYVTIHKMYTNSY